MICIECNRNKPEHVFCRFCMQEIINKCNSEGALEAYREIINAFFDSDSGKHIKQFCEKRIKELEEEGVEQK